MVEMLVGLKAWTLAVWKVVLKAGQLVGYLVDEMAGLMVVWTAEKRVEWMAADLAALWVARSVDDLAARLVVVTVVG